MTYIGLCNTNRIQIFGSQKLIKFRLSWWDTTKEYGTRLMQPQRGRGLNCPGI